MEGVLEKGGKVWKMNRSEAWGSFRKDDWLTFEQKHATSILLVPGKCVEGGKSSLQLFMWLGKRNTCFEPDRIHEELYSEDRCLKGLYNER